MNTQTKWTAENVTDRQARIVCHIPEDKPVTQEDREVTAADFNGTNTPAPDKIQLPWIQTYGNYTSDNYGAHALQVRIGNATVWFSYQTPVAFKVDGFERVVRQNDWSTTTGKHLNAIDGGDKKNRVDGATFERLFNEQFGALTP